MDSGEIDVTTAEKIADLPKADQKKIVADSSPKTAIKKQRRRTRESALAKKTEEAPRGPLNPSEASPYPSGASRARTGDPRLAKAKRPITRFHSAPQFGIDTGDSVGRPK